MKTTARVSVLVVAVLVAIVSAWFYVRPASQSIRFSEAASGDGTFSYESYAPALNRYVDDEGLVDYRGFKANRGDLDAFATSLATLDPKEFESWEATEKIAFLVNAYNALTLEAILAHYPIQPSITGSLLYPRNSIRQIPGVWDKLNFLVMGREITLDHIEHKILRKEFDEPRIHLALVCAAMGCPPLRSEPYVAERLEQQFEDQGRRFVADPRKFRIDRSQQAVLLSSIFKWYGEDFIGAYGSNQFSGSGSERAVLNYLSRFLDTADREWLAAGGYRISYLDYDWSLNEQGAEQRAE